MRVGPRPRSVGFAVLVALAASCGSGGDVASPTTTLDASPDTGPDSGPTTVAPPTTTEPPPTTTEPFVAPTRTRLVVSGPEEIVFDWTSDRCEDANIPDISARAFRDAGGTVHLTIGHWDTYRMSGPSLDEVVSDCTAPILVSPYESDPARFADSWWIGSPYTLDGETVYAVVHNE